MAAGPGKWGRSRFNYPTETAVNDIHETTVQPGGDVTAVTAFIACLTHRQSIRLKS
jgi:hypothetical protein